MANNSTQKRFKYDVFLSFRGDDTRKNFVDHLYHALKQKSIVTYKDDENIKQGKMISDELIEAIEDSKFYIIVFSKNYASSSWCLEELVKIMECQKMDEHTAYPVFYDVEPTEVRKQSGSDGDAFSKHKEDEAARKLWREALKEASDLAGWELKSIANGHEAKFIQKIVEEISLELRFINSSIDGDLIGMETRVNEVISSLEPGVSDVRMLGIWGMGGAGKTTLARAVFDQISFQFEGHSFVENVREVSKASLEGLKKLQKQVLSDVLKDQNIKVSSVSGGKNMLQKMMRGRKVLVVLDDVDHKDQLEALAGDHNWFKPGSRIIFTTRDEQVLVAHRVSLIHNVTLLSQAEAGCLFSRYAFGRENPIQGYEELSGKVLQYADGLPLTIKVMGSFLCGQSEPYWIDAIERLKTIPLRETLEKLELSYIGLEDDYKEIFLDVACILKGWLKEDAIRVLESRGFHAEVGLRVLEQRSLITYNEYGKLGMHDHLEEMGRNVVRRLHPDEPNKHSRLWIGKEVEYLLTNDLGTEATKCLYFSPPNRIVEIAMKGLANMKDLRFIDVEQTSWSLYGCDTINWKFDNVRQYLPNSLQFVKWNCFPFSSLPNTFQGKHLVGLEMSSSNIVQLWEDGEEKVLSKLRFLTISYSKFRTFDFRVAPNLEWLSIYRCYDFVELHMTAQYLKIKYLDLSFSKLTTLNLGVFPNVERLLLTMCTDLVELQMPVENLKFKYLDLSCSSQLKTIHIGNTPNLETLILRQCHDLVELQMSVENLKLKNLDLSYTQLKTVHLKNTPNLETLFLEGCNRVVELQMPNENLKLKHLSLSYTKFKTFHLGYTPNLEKLVLAVCKDLVELQLPVENLKLRYLDLNHSKLKTIHLGNTPNIERLVLPCCRELVELQMPVEYLKLEYLDLRYSQLKTVHLGNAPNIKTLILRRCNDLVELLMPVVMLKLEMLDLAHSKLKTIHVGNTPNLERIILEGCNDLVEFQMPVENLKLKKLDLISHSKLKTIHLGNTPNLERLILRGCNDLVELQMPVENLKLEYLDLAHSKFVKTIHLGNTPNLESLILRGCNELVELQIPVECLKLKYLDLSHSKLRILDLGLTPNLKRINLENCYGLVDINAPVGCLRNIAFLDLSGCGRFKSFLFDKQLDSLEVGSLSELHLIAEPTNVCPLHYDNKFPKFKFSCFYKEDPASSSFGNLETLISIGLCACTNLETFSRSICSLQCIRKLTLEGGITKAPRDLDQLECLEELIFSSTNFRNLPDSICKMKHLKSLKLKSCLLLEKLPDDLGRIESLETLIISECNLLRDIPNNIGGLACLKQCQSAHKALLIVIMWLDPAFGHIIEPLFIVDYFRVILASYILVIYDFLRYTPKSNILCK